MVSVLNLKKSRQCSLILKGCTVQRRQFYTEIQGWRDSRTIINPKRHVRLKSILFMSLHEQVCMNDIKLKDIVPLRRNFSSVNRKLHAQRKCNGKRTQR